VTTNLKYFKSLNEIYVPDQKEAILFNQIVRWDLAELKGGQRAKILLVTVVVIFALRVSDVKKSVCNLC
jgi:hypothetical protein